MDLCQGSLKMTAKKWIIQVETASKIVIFTAFGLGDWFPPIKSKMAAMKDDFYSSATLPHKYKYIKILVSVKPNITSTYLILEKKKNIPNF